MTKLLYDVHDHLFYVQYYVTHIMYVYKNLKLCLSTV